MENRNLFFFNGHKNYDSSKFSIRWGNHKFLQIDEIKTTKSERMLLRTWWKKNKLADLVKKNQVGVSYHKSQISTILHKKAINHGNLEVWEDFDKRFMAFFKISPKS